MRNVTNQNTLLLISLFILALSISCQNEYPKTISAPIKPTSEVSIPIETQPFATIIPPVIATEVATRTSVITLSVIQPTLGATEIVTPTQTAVPDSGIQNRCIDNSQSLESNSLSGKLVLQDPHIINGAYFEDFATGNQSSVFQTAEMQPMDFAVSPDGKLLAYLGAVTAESRKYALIVTTPDGQWRKAFSQEELDFASIAYWLDNNWLVLQRINVEGLDWIILLNPVTGEKRVLKPNLPNIESDDFNSFWPGLAFYNPGLTYVVYPKHLDSGPLVLLDLKTKQFVVELPFTRSLAYPLWFSKGEDFVYVEPIGEQKPGQRPNQEWMRVDIHGNIFQVTNLNKYFKLHRIFNASLSSNGRYLAFWLLSNTASQVNDYLELTVLDLDRKTLANYCISTFRSDTPQPIWSPDNYFMAVAVWKDSTKEHAETFLVDLATGARKQIATNYIPAGWMVNSK